LDFLIFIRTINRPTGNPPKADSTPQYVFDLMIGVVGCKSTRIY
jgi:hypothetical protein